MVLKNVFRKGDIAPQEYVTEDRRYYVHKNKSGPGWDVFKLSSDNKYRFYKTFPNLKAIRELP